MSEPNTEAAVVPEAEPPIKLPPHPPPANKLLHRSGLALTGSWVLGWIIYVAINREAVGGLAPNEAGDFLAGVFAPLAFLWLVLGFFQQGQELRHSAEALWLQGRELQNSVEQQRDLVNVTREQLAFESARLAGDRAEIDRAAQPIFEVHAAGGTPAEDRAHRYFRFRMTNHGRNCTEFSATLLGRVVLREPVIPTGNSVDFTVKMEVASEEVMALRLSYRDANLNPKSEEWSISKSSQTFTIQRATG